MSVQRQVYNVIYVNKKNHNSTLYLDYFVKKGGPEDLFLAELAGGSGSPPDPPLLQINALPYMYINKI